MQFTKTPLEGAYIVKLDEHWDERGFFARMFCAREFADHGLDSSMVQANLSFNRYQGTIRGLHYQLEPDLECKYVRCISGCIHDVIVDLRKTSSTYLQSYSIELSASNRQALVVPPMFAHGFQTLQHETEVMYLVSGFYQPASERGLRFDDPKLMLDWPLPPANLSPKDAKWPLLDGTES